ncbi:MAG: hypothetical protein Q9180_005740 [Flavoplaca navasiana]
MNPNHFTLNQRDPKGREQPHESSGQSPNMSGNLRPDVPALDLHASVCEQALPANSTESITSSPKMDILADDQSAVRKRPHPAELEIVLQARVRKRRQIVTLACPTPSIDAIETSRASAQLDAMNLNPSRHDVSISPELSVMSQSTSVKDEPLNHILTLEHFPMYQYALRCQKEKVFLQRLSSVNTRKKLWNLSQKEFEEIWFGASDEVSDIMRGNEALDAQVQGLQKSLNLALSPDDDGEFYRKQQNTITTLKDENEAYEEANRHLLEKIKSMESEHHDSISEYRSKLEGVSRQFEALIPGIQTHMHALQDTISSLPK